MSILKGSQIELRTLKPTFENAKRLLNIIQKNQEHLSVGLPCFMAQRDTPQKIQELLEYQREKQQSGLGLYYYIFKKDTLIGEIHVTGHSYSDKSEITYWLTKDAQKKGYMSEALKMVEQEHFTHNKTMLVGVVLPAAVRSGDLLKASGYKNRGLAYYKTLEMYLDGLSVPCKVDTHSKGCRILEGRVLGRGRE